MAEQPRGARGTGWFRLWGAPLCTLPRGVQWALVAVLPVLVLLASYGLERRMDNPFDLPDANQYIAMAKGQIGRVTQPFASRPLAPLLAQKIAAAEGRPVEATLFQLAAGSLLCTAGVVCWLAMRTRAPRWVLPLLLLVPFWPQVLHQFALPDLWYAAVLSVFLVCLAVDRPLLAAGMIFPLMVSRESTSLVLVCLLVVGWRRLGWAGSALAVVAAGAGSVVVRHLSAGNLGNAEHLPQTVYMAAKVPWNLLRTLGVAPWSNLYPFLCGAPAWQHALHLGPLRSVGVCGISGQAPFQAALALLTTFGLLPALLVPLWRARRAAGGATEVKTSPDLVLRFSVLYGGICVLLTPMLGTAYVRLFGYAWPLLLVAVPRLFPAGAAVAAGQEQGGVRGVGLWVGGVVVLHLLLGQSGLAWPPNLAWSALLMAAGVGLVLWQRAAFRAASLPETPPSAW